MKIQLLTFKPLPAPQRGAVWVGEYAAHKYLTARVLEHNHKVAVRWCGIAVVAVAAIIGAVIWGIVR